MKQTPLHLGTWLSVGSSALAELAALSGFDWVLFDLEHGCESEASLPDQIRALRFSNTRAFVRVGAPHSDLIARVLDWGAHGIMVPHVNSAAEAEHMVQAAHFAPRGHRGVARTVRACDYGLGKPPTDGPKPILMAQIETVDAVNRVDEIAAVDGISVLFVGPADLQFDLTHHAAEAPGDYQQCLRVVTAAAQRANKSAGILIRDAADVNAHREIGFGHIAVDSDLSIIRKAYQQIVSSSRK